MLVAFSRHKRSCLRWRLGLDILQANRLFAIIILIKILMIDIPGKRQGIVIIIVIMMMIQAMLMMFKQTEGGVRSPTDNRSFHGANNGTS